MCNRTDGGVHLLHSEKGLLRGSSSRSGMEVRNRGHRCESGGARITTDMRTADFSLGIGVRKEGNRGRGGEAAPPIH